MVYIGEASPQMLHYKWLTNKGISRHFSVDGLLRHQRDRLGGFNKPFVKCFSDRLEPIDFGRLRLYGMDSSQESRLRLNLINKLFIFNEIEVWLPGMDSNHDSRLQRPLSYH